MVDEKMIEIKWQQSQQNHEGVIWHTQRVIEYKGSCIGIE